MNRLEEKFKLINQEQCNNKGISYFTKFKKFIMNLSFRGIYYSLLMAFSIYLVIDGLFHSTFALITCIWISLILIGCSLALENIFKFLFRKLVK